MVVTAVVLAAVIGAQTSQSILFRTLFGLGCLLYAWLGERLARVRVQVHGGQLIVHNELRTRTVNASDVREITWDWWRNRGTWRVVPRVHLADGGSFRLSALWSHGSRQAELVTTVEEILSLLGVHVPVQGQPPDQASDQDRDSSLLGAHLPVQEQFPGQLPDQAAAPDSSSGLPDQSPVGLPRRVRRRPAAAAPIPQGTAPLAPGRAWPRVGRPLHRECHSPRAGHSAVCRAGVAQPHQIHSEAPP